MPLILPHPIMPTLTAASSLMVAPFSRLACQLVSLSRAQVLDDKAAEPERADWLFSSARPEHAAFDYLFGLWQFEVFCYVAPGSSRTRVLRPTVSSRRRVLCCPRSRVCALRRRWWSPGPRWRGPRACSTARSAC